MIRGIIQALLMLTLIAVLVDIADKDIVIQSILLLICGAAMGFIVGTEITIKGAWKLYYPDHKLSRKALEDAYDKIIGRWY